MSFTKEQPKVGTTIMHCGHLDCGVMHWFQYEKPIGFTRPDQTRGTAEWFAACQSCFITHGKKVASIVRGDAIWAGGATIEKEES